MAGVTPQSTSQIGHPSPIERARVGQQEHVSSNRSVSGQAKRQSQGHMTAPPKPWELDGNARRRRVRSHLMQCSFVRPDNWVEKTPGIGKPLMEQQDWDETQSNCWHRSIKCARTELSRTDRRLRNNYQIHSKSRRHSPCRFESKQQPSNLRQTLPAVKSPLPHDAGGTAS